MTRYPYVLAFLLLLGVIDAQAQTPLVYINQGANQCVVTPGNPIFQLDTTGNVLITGTLSGSCGGGGGGNSLATFTPFSPPPAVLTVNGSTSASVTAGATGTASLAYSAYFATSCSVAAGAGVASPSGTCPQVTTSGASCTGTGTQLSCTPSNATVSVPASLASGTSCAYSVTATCQPGGASSSASLTVNSQGGNNGTGFGVIPAGCATVASNLGSGIGGGFWTWQKSSTVEYGDGTTHNGVDVTNYATVWGGPWPDRGINVRTTANKNNYLAEGFTVPADGSVTGSITWGNTGSGNLSAASYAISSCPGDFGQTGTKITDLTDCRAPASASGFSVMVSAIPIAFTCTVVPGQTYYLNILSQANLPKNDSSTSSCTGASCTPWTQAY